MSREDRLARFAHLPVLEPLVGMLPEGHSGLWPTLGDVPAEFVLYGGTGLAIRLGHRRSEDFDFFSAASFNPTDLLGEIAWLGRVTIKQAASNHLVITTAGGVNLSFLGAMGLQTVAEPAIVEENGLVVASLFDLAGTKAKAILDRSEWRDYVDIATLLRHGLTLPEIIGFATAIFEPLFEFPAAVFLRALAWFGDGTAADVPDDVRHELERAVVQAEHAEIPVVVPYSASIVP